MNERSAQCRHPSEQRWQYRDMWLCCACGRHFWGKKDTTPETDIYGQPTMMLERTKTTDRMAAAIRCGCEASNVHLRCSFPECSCTTIPAAVRAAVEFAIRGAAKDFVKEITRSP